MQAGIFSRTYAAKGEAVFAAMKADGFSAAQLNLSSLGLQSLPAALDEAVLLNAKADAARHDLQLMGLSGTYNMAHPDPAYRSGQRLKFAHVLRAARLMGIDVVTLCTGSRDANNMWAHHPDNHSAEAGQVFRSELDAVLKMAGGLVLAIEPEPGNVVRDAKVARALLDDIRAPNLKIILDAANLLSPETLPRQKDIMAEAFDLLGADTVQAHAKDIDLQGCVTAPGQGAVDLKMFVAGLRRVNYTGPLVAHGFAEKDTLQAGHYLGDLLA